MSAASSSWKHTPFREGKPIPYRATWSDVEFTSIRAGLIPAQMEDKWFIYYDEPHLFLHRSWSGQPVYRLAIVQGNKGFEVAESLWSTELASARGADSDYQAKLLDFLISNLLLGQSKHFPMPAGSENHTHPGALQHVISGTGYAEELPKLRKPWWRFW
jgi:hypothetical protein